MNSSQYRFLHWLAILAFMLGLATQVDAQGRKKNPTSKLYVADVEGDAQIDTGETIDPLTKRSVYTAQGTVIETKAEATNAIVFSNGSGVYFDPETRVEVRKFVQEPFTPNRRDMEVEPSISTTQAFLSRGTVGLCTSKMVAGSSMRYATPHANIRINARKVVIESTNEGTTISLLDGSVTVQSGNLDAGGQTIETGQQMFVPASGGPPQIGPIPSDQMPALDDKVAIACMARKTVYFESQERETQNEAAENGDEITAFDEAEDEGEEIVAVETTPEEIPVELTVSAARLPPTQTQ